MDRLARQQPRILVVDDEPSLRQLMAEVLADAGYDVRASENGAEALAMLRDVRPDVVVVDLMMPVLDGWAFIEKCRDARRGDVAIVSVSAAMTDRTAERLRGSGVRVCLAKPFDIGELVGAVAQALAVSEGSGENQNGSSVGGK
jgi:CheY-like chemotaxis protein